jgi:hypothetical protein
MVQYILGLHEATKLPRCLVVNGVDSSVAGKWDVSIFVRDNAEVAAHRSTYQGAAGPEIAAVIAATDDFKGLVQLIESTAAKHHVKVVALNLPQHWLMKFKQAGLA